MALEEDRRRPIYMQDGASIHFSLIPCLWLCLHRIEVIEWPPSSTGLNSTENMGRGIKGRN